MKFKITLFFITVSLIVLFAGFGTLAYFLVHNSSQIKIFKTQKIDIANVYDRKTIDQKIPSTTGTQGPAGPKGAKATTELELEINNLYPFDYFGRLPVETPIVLKFSADFKNKPFAKTTFMGWITRTVDSEQELIGQIFKDDENKKLGDYKIFTTRWDTKDFTNHIAWDFIKLTSKELNEEYLSKIQLDTQLAKKAETTASYTKVQIANIASQKANRESTYLKSELDNKFKAIAPPADTYSETEIDSKIAPKADASDTYTKSEIDTTLSNKIDKWKVYPQAQMLSELNKKAQSGNTLSKAQIDQAHRNRESFWWTKFIKTGQSSGQTTTKVIGNSEFSTGGFQGDTFYPKTGKSFKKGDKLTVLARIKSDYVGWQGLQFKFRNSANPPGTSSVLNINNLQHWRRWYQSNLIRTEKLSKTFSPAQLVDNYPLTAAKNTFFNFFHLKIVFLFNDDHIRVFTTGLSNEQLHFSEEMSVAILDYPSWYDVDGYFDPKDEKAIWIESITNKPLDFSSGQATSASGNFMKTGSELVFIREFANDEFRLKIKTS